MYIAFRSVLSLIHTLAAYKCSRKGKHFCLFNSNAADSKIIATVTPALRAIGEKENYLKEGLMDTLKLNNSLIPYAATKVIALTINLFQKPSCYTLCFMFWHSKWQRTLNYHRFSSDHSFGSFFAQLAKIRVHNAFIRIIVSMKNLIRPVLKNTLQFKACEFSSTWYTLDCWVFGMC